MSSLDENPTDGGGKAVEFSSLVFCEVRDSGSAQTVNVAVRKGHRDTIGIKFNLRINLRLISLRTYSVAMPRSSKWMEYSGILMGSQRFPCGPWASATNIAAATLKEIVSTKL